MIRPRSACAHHRHGHVPHTSLQHFDAGGCGNRKGCEEREDERRFPVPALASGALEALSTSEKVRSAQLLLSLLESDAFSAEGGLYRTVIDTCGANPKGSRHTAIGNGEVLGAAGAPPKSRERSQPGPGGATAMLLETVTPPGWRAVD